MDLSQQIRQLGTRAAGAVMRVRQARTLRQVRDFGRIAIPGYLRPTANTLPEMRQLKTAQKTRAQELVDADLKRLSAIATQEIPAEERFKQLKDAYGALTMNEWVFLRGEHPSVLSNATHEAGKLLFKARADATA